MEEAIWKDVQLQCPDVQRVDLLVALPSFNQSSTIGLVIKAILDGLQSSLADASVLIINADVGSRDGTPAIVKQAVGGLYPLAYVQPLGEGRSSTPYALNRMSYSGMPGREEAFQCFFAMTERLQAKACVVIDTDIRSVTAEWVHLLAQPVLEKGADFVAPVFRRLRYEGSLTNNLIAPLTRSLYGKRVACQVGGGYGFSQKLASFYLQNDFLWQGDAARFAVDSWLTTVAVAEGYQVWQARLGTHIRDSKASAPDVSMSLAQAVGASYHFMERYQDVWEKQSGSSAVQEVGQAMKAEVEPAPIQVDRMMKGFRQGLRDLLPIWEVILAPETLAGVLALGLREDDEFRFPLSLWVPTVYDFAIAYHENVIHREHLLKSLMPLYLGRTASLILETRRGNPDEAQHVVEEGCQTFETMKPYLVDRWRFQ